MKFAVLMSAYGDSPFLKEQLESILSSANGMAKIFIRCDGTPPPDCLADFSDQLVSVVETQPNLGTAKSFMRLISLVPAEFDVVAFADQDDVWDKAKISRINDVLAASDQESAILYLGGHIVVDSALNTIRLGDLAVNVCFLNALIENQVPGCCMAMNRALHRIAAVSQPRSILMHDWWLYLLASGIGEVINDTTSRYTLYRQHGRNQIGSQTKSIGNALSRVGKKFSDRNFHRISEQAAELLTFYSAQINAENKKTIVGFLKARTSTVARLKWLVSGSSRRHGSGGGVVWHLQFLFGLY